MKSYSASTASPQDNPILYEHVNLWKEYNFIVNAMISWYLKSINDRVRLLANPWEFTEWLVYNEESQQRPIRHILLHLLFPYAFFDNNSLIHKRQIVNALSAESINTQTVNVDLTLEGFSVKARSIDLAQDWREIHQSMLSLI